MTCYDMFHWAHTTHAAVHGSDQERIRMKQLDGRDETEGLAVVSCKGLTLVEHHLIIITILHDVVVLYYYNYLTIYYYNDVVLLYY